MTKTVAETASTLLEELAMATPEALRFLVASPRFHRGDLLDLILHQAQTTLLSDPGKLTGSHSSLSGLRAASRPFSILCPASRRMTGRTIAEPSRRSNRGSPVSAMSQTPRKSSASTLSKDEPGHALASSIKPSGFPAGPPWTPNA